MNRDDLPRLACFALALAVVFAGSSLYYGTQAGQYERALEGHNQRALNMLLEDLDGLSAALDKTAYAGEGAMGSVLAAEIWRRSEGAKTALALLPLGQARLEQYEGFLAQAGGYAYSLLRGGLYGVRDGEADARLASLAQVSAALNGGMAALKERADAGEAVFSAAARGQGAQDTVAAAFAAREADFPDYEPLSYDGLYSEHLTRPTARALKGQPALSEEQARAAAARLCGLTPSSLSLSYAGEGVIPFYVFSDGAGLSVRISRSGGFPVALRDERESGQAVLTGEQAAQKAAEWLQNSGYAGVQPVWYTLTGGTARVRCYAVQDGARLYPDLIELDISLDDGTLVRADATGYLMNHRARTLPAHDLAAAPEGADSGGGALVLIPTDGGSERWCRQYAFAREGGKALVFVGCESGEVEDLRLMTQDERGTLLR